MRKIDLKHYFIFSNNYKQDSLFPFVICYPRRRNQIVAKKTASLSTGLREPEG